MVCSGTILRFIVSKVQKILDPKKIEALVKMTIPKTPHEIQVFNGMAQFYKYFIKIFAFIMAPITKLLKKTKMFEWIIECQTAWEDIKNQYIQAPIFINPNWALEFHVHINASQLIVGAILAHNPTSEINQPIKSHQDYLIMLRKTIPLHIERL
jgi:hypothetical protein